MPFPAKKNPFVSTDQHVIRFLSVWMFPPGTSKEDLESYDLACLERDVQLVEAAYVAIFQSYPGGPETGVYALQFRDPIPRDLRARLEANDVIVSGRLGVLVWTDSEDRSCYKAVRTSIEKSLD
jgi:hypothetical protein